MRDALRAPYNRGMASDDSRMAFVERFADHWAARGAPRIEGLIAGYLLVDDSAGVSAAELAERLGISAGSVSTYTRQLIKGGFISLVRKKGQRSHFYVMSDDVWAGFLAAEQEYLRNQQALAAELLPHVPEGGPSWRRVRNMRDYMTWLIDERLPETWEDIKAQRDGTQ